jgi:hypothetical protein
MFRDTLFRKIELVVLNNFQTKGIIYMGKVHIFVPKYYLAFQFDTKGIMFKMKNKIYNTCIFFLINYFMNEIVPFRKSYYRLVLANFHFMLNSKQNYSCLEYISISDQSKGMIFPLGEMRYPFPKN